MSESERKGDSSSWLLAGRFAAFSPRSLCLVHHQSNGSVGYIRRHGERKRKSAAFSSIGLIGGWRDNRSHHDPPPPLQKKKSPEESSAFLSLSFYLLLLQYTSWYLYTCSERGASICYFSFWRYFLVGLSCSLPCRAPLLPISAGGREEESSWRSISGGKRERGGVSSCLASCNPLRLAAITPTRVPSE